MDVESDLDAERRIALQHRMEQIMVGIDERWERLKLIRAAQWQVPADHADLDPPHEALQLREQYREASRLATVQERKDEFRQWLSEAEDGASILEQSLRGNVDSKVAEAAFRKLTDGCPQCHARYRDTLRN